MSKNRFEFTPPWWGSSCTSSELGKDCPSRSFNFIEPLTGLPVRMTRRCLHVRSTVIQYVNLQRKKHRYVRSDEKRTVPANLPDKRHGYLRPALNPLSASIRQQLQYTVSVTMIWSVRHRGPILRSSCSIISAGARWLFSMLSLIRGF